MNLRSKRLRLMRDTQWRGYARTAEGNPITLSQARSVVSLSVLGNSSQDGTPSPDNPVEVIGTGERTGNLFDISQINGAVSTMVRNENSIMLSGYSCTSNLLPETFLKMTGLKPGDTVTTSRIFDVINGTVNGVTGRISFTGRQDGVSTFILIDGSDKFRSVLIPDNFNNNNYTQAIFYGAVSGDIKEVVFTDIQILKGEYTAETLPDYEPYGYKVAVQARGRNLFDLSLLENKTIGYVEDNNIYVTGYPYTTNISPEKFLEITGMQEGDTFTASCNVCYETDMRDSKYMVFVAKGDNKSNFILNFTKQGMNIKTSVVPENFNSDNYDSLYIYCGNLPNLVIGDLRGVINQFMILKGTYTADTLPLYEPYKEPQSFNVYTTEPLQGVGDAHDTVILDFDKHKAELIQKYYRYDFSGDETIISEISANLPRFVININANLKSERYKTPNNRFDTIGAFDSPRDNVAFAYLNKVYIYMFSCDTAKDLREFLKNNTTYAYIPYPESLPTTTDITALQDWDALPQLRGTWILTASGGTEPVLKADYYSEERSTE